MTSSPRLIKEAAEETPFLTKETFKFPQEKSVKTANENYIKKLILLMKVTCFMVKVAL